MAGGISIRRFNWVRSQTAWESIQSWRDKRSAMVADFQQAASSFSNSVWSAQSNLSDGLAKIAAQTAATRIQDAIGAKINTTA